MIDGQVVSTDYKASPIPSCGLEIPLLLTFTVERKRIHIMMKNFVSDLYDYYNYTGKTKEEDNYDEEGDDDVVINLER